MVSKIRVEKRCVYDCKNDIYQEIMKWKLID
jgi:hypothetical protein